MSIQEVASSALFIDCLIWHGAANNGYGIRSWPGKSYAYVHRVAFEEAYGLIPPNCQIHHCCGVRLCYNPEHLELVTPRQHRTKHKPEDHHKNKTHCPQGHLYDEVNTIVYHGTRYCRQCGREYRKRWNKAHRDRCSEATRRWRARVA